MGPVMLDCVAEEIQAQDKELLEHPATGGVILFSRNYHDKQQLRELIRQIRLAARGDILIAVDHEGGRVQRFRDGFTKLPAMGHLTNLAQQGAPASELALACGQVMAYELKQMDIDMSFAPVLDVNGISEVIGDRSFSPEPKEVAELASALIEGMRSCNMPVTGKHFPGHGSVQADSHVAVPVDSRELDDIIEQDVVPFAQLIKAGLLDCIMPAHVIYDRIDDKPAGFSPYWIQQVLRQQLGFDGALFSDDLSMHGASVVGGYLARAEAALEAGCDMVLACNNPTGAGDILDGLGQNWWSNTRLTRLVNRPLPSEAKLRYNTALSVIGKVFG